MPVSMTLQKLPKKEKQIKAMLSKELNFLKNVFSVMSLPKQMRGDFFYYSGEVYRNLGNLIYKVLSLKNYIIDARFHYKYGNVN